MRRVLIDALSASAKNLTNYPIADEETHHLTTVLRARAGDLFEILDGAGHFFAGTLELLGKGRGQIRRTSEVESDPARTSVDLTLEIATLKGDAMDWVIEKSVELGVRALVPLLTDHTVVQTGRKSPAEFRTRWQKIADQALKQCGRLDRLRIAEPIALEARLQSAPSDRRLWADERERSRTIESALAETSGSARTLLIGPEGGWSERESHFLRSPAANTVGVTLGPWVLRAETAALLGAGLCVASVRNFR